MDDAENPTLPAEEITLRTEEEFPLRIDCPQCKRPYRTETLQTQVNTLLTETLLTCPRCRAQLRRMKLKDWYDHYVQGQTLEPVRDEGTFASKMTGIPRTPLNLQPRGRRSGSRKHPQRQGQRPQRQGPPQQQPQRQAQQQQRPPDGNVQGPRPPDGRGGGRRRRRRRRR